MKSVVEKRRRLILLDVLKILFAFFVFLRHSATMGGCTYGAFNSEFLRSINNVMMSGFFILSGFSLYYVYSLKDMKDMKTTFDFYKKRAIAILPIYFLVIILHFIFLESDIITNLKLLPIEVTGIHTYFNGTFFLLHNGTTWFVSIIILAYFLYPHLQEVIKFFDKRKKIILFIILLCFLTYFPFFFEWFNVSGTYANPLFRLIEFIFGMSLCSIIDFKKDRNKSYKYLIMFIGLLIIESLGVYYNIKAIDIFKYVILGLILYTGSLYNPVKERKYAVINFLAHITYPFYIFQDLLWIKSTKLNPYIQSFDSNILRIVMFFTILFTLSVASIYLYQNPISNYLKSRMKKE